MLRKKERGVGIIFYDEGSSVILYTPTQPPKLVKQKAEDSTKLRIETNLD